MTTIIIYLGIFAVGFFIGIISNKLFERDKKEVNSDFDYEEMSNSIFGDML